MLNNFGLLRIGLQAGEQLLFSWLELPNFLQ